MTLFTDPVQSALERAMDGTALRQRVQAQNVANAMTPGYRAQLVDFESALGDALAGGGPLGNVPVQITSSTETPREDGNNVRLDVEQTGLMRSGLQFEALVDAANYRLNVLKAAMR